MDEKPAEAELIARGKQGDSKAFAEAIRPYLPMLFAYSRAICGDAHAAEDVVQETVLIAFKNLSHLFPESDFGTWLRAIARRKGLEARRMLARPRLIGTEIMETVYECPTPLAGSPRYEALQQCLQVLGGNLRKVIQDHYFKGSRVAELATNLGLKVNAVKQLLFRARSRLRECIQKRLLVENA